MGACRPHTPAQFAWEGGRHDAHRRGLGVGLLYWILVFWTFLCLSRGQCGACILCHAPQLKISIYFLNFTSRVCDRCTSQLRTHAKHTHKHIGVDWRCPGLSLNRQPRPKAPKLNFCVFAFLCLSTGHAEACIEWLVPRLQLSYIFWFSAAGGVTGAPINSEYMPNTSTNTLQSIGGVPETSAGTNVTKTPIFTKIH